MARARKQNVEIMQGARVAELEMDNARLQVELEQVCLALAEADAS
jgi:hypothetical protein